eukprot:700135-Amorphochlora_amoeboformis.AAC.1
MPSSQVPPVPPEASDKAREFVSACLVRDPRRRPNATKLLTYEFVKKDLKDIANFSHQSTANSICSAPCSPANNRLPASSRKRGKYSKPPPLSKRPPPLNQASASHPHSFRPSVSLASASSTGPLRRRLASTSDITRDRVSVGTARQLDDQLSMVHEHAPVVPWGGDKKDDCKHEGDRISTGEASTAVRSKPDKKIVRSSSAQELDRLATKSLERLAQERIDRKRSSTSSCPTCQNLEQGATEGMIEDFLERASIAFEIKEGDSADTKTNRSSDGEVRREYRGTSGSAAISITYHCKTNARSIKFDDLQHVINFNTIDTVNHVHGPTSGTKYT